MGELGASFEVITYQKVPCLYIARSPIAGNGIFTQDIIHPGYLFNPLRGQGMNHSCDANCMIARDDWGYPIGGADIVALRTIKPGEELTVDYRTSWRSRSSNPVELMIGVSRCNCPRCRARVGSHSRFRKRIER